MPQSIIHKFFLCFFYQFYILNRQYSHVSEILKNKYFIYSENSFFTQVFLPQNFFSFLSTNMGFLCIIQSICAHTSKCKLIYTDCCTILFHLIYLRGYFISAHSSFSIIFYVSSICLNRDTT